MQNNKLDRIRERLETLDKMSMEQLQSKFEELYGFQCGDTTARNLRLRLAYRIQEIFLGGLSDKDAEVLDAIADKDPLANLQKVPVKHLVKTEGARFIREWRGNTYEVVVLGDGKYEFAGIVYKSLSAIAGKITGTHWNGKAFFGVK